MEREFLQGLRVDDAPLPETVIDAILEKHEQAVSRVRFDGLLDRAILAARGRSAKAITALLDLDTLQTSEDPETAVGQALAALKKDCGYLFEEKQTPPPYAGGTGAQVSAEPAGPATLADALRERYERK